MSEIECAIITTNINQRIRKSGFSSKEICFQRDLILNTNKEVNDKVVADEIIEARQKQHNKPSCAGTFEPSIGLNVYLKNDKSKLKARQMYKIIEIFDKDNEKWITIQKHDSQFRQKSIRLKFLKPFRYLVKVSLFQIQKLNIDPDQ